MLIVMHVLLRTYQPEPNGFRFNTVTKTVSFAVFTSVPIWFGLGTRTRIGTSLIGLLQALSPLALVGTMRDPLSDLDFAILLWWFPMPTVAALMMIVDNVAGSRRRRGLQQPPSSQQRGALVPAFCVAQAHGNAPRITRRGNRPPRRVVPRVLARSARLSTT